MIISNTFMLKENPPDDPVTETDMILFYIWIFQLKQ